MSWSTQITVFCDICSDWDQYSWKSIRVARRDLKKKGWRTLRVEGRTVDKCPKCMNAWQGLDQ